jgi:hypothetical protein
MVIDQNFSATGLEMVRFVPAMIKPTGSKAQTGKKSISPDEIWTQRQFMGTRALHLQPHLLRAKPNMRP